jgi:uncharacterized membrane protein
MVMNGTKSALSDLEKKQTEMEQRHIKEKDEAVKAVTQSKDELIKKQENQLQSSANSLYGADLAFKAYKQPSRLDLIVNNRVNEAFKSIGKPPTFEAMKEENLRLQKEMDEVKTSLASLQSEHERVMKEKEQLVNEKNEAVVKERQATANLSNIETKHTAESNELNGKIKEKQKELIDEQAKAIDREKDLKAIKTKISTVCGIIALLCLAGAIYSPVFKGKFGLMSSILGLCAIGVWFIEPWMVAVGFGTIFVCVLGFFAWEHHISDSANENMINAIQDHKEKGNGADLKTHLKEWNTKYIKKDGEYVEVADKRVEDYINKKLMDYGRLNTEKKP